MTNHEPTKNPTYFAILNYDGSSIVFWSRDRSLAEKRAAELKTAITPITALNDPLDWKIPVDVKIGRGTIRKGCRFRTLLACLDAIDKHWQPKPEVIAAAMEIAAKYCTSQPDHIGDANKMVTPEPFGYFKAEPFGWTDCAETDEGATALYETPPDMAELVAAAKAVIDRWDTPHWKDVPATAEYIARLRNAVNAANSVKT